MKPSQDEVKEWLQKASLDLVFGKGFARTRSSCAGNCCFSLPTGGGKNVKSVVGLEECAI